MIPAQHPFIRVGHARKSFGTTGHMRCSIDWDLVQEIPTGSFLFLEMDGIKVPFQVEEIDEKSSPLIKFGGIDSPEEALLLSNHEIFVLSEHGSGKNSPESGYEQIVGFEIYDDLNKMSIGKIRAVREMPGQWMAVIGSDDEEILIPLVEDFITDIAPDAEVIYMKLPEGLVDLQE